MCHESSIFLKSGPHARQADHGCFRIYYKRVQPCSWKKRSLDTQKVWKLPKFGLKLQRDMFSLLCHLEISVPPASYRVNEITRLPGLYYLGQAAAAALIS